MYEERGLSGGELSRGVVQSIFDRVDCGFYPVEPVECVSCACDGGVDSGDEGVFCGVYAEEAFYCCQEVRCGDVSVEVVFAEAVYGADVLRGSGAGCGVDPCVKLHDEFPLVCVFMPCGVLVGFERSDGVVEGLGVHGGWGIVGSKFI